MTQDRFPVGGEREPVYQFLRQHGFTMSDWSDKCWKRADGLEAHLYGTGSMLRIRDRVGRLIADGHIEDAINQAKRDV